MTASGSTASTININATNGIPAYFRIPATLTVTSGATTRTVTCTGRTATTFVGCTTSPSTFFASGATVSGAVNSGWADPFTATTTSTSSWTGSSSATTLSVASTATFAPSFLFVDNLPVTCAGYDATPRFTSCSGLTSSPGSGVAVTNGALAPTGINLIGGYLKIEMQNAAGVWSDVTMEILNLGIGAPNQDGTQCDDPTPHAVLRLQRLRDNGGGSANCVTAPNSYAASTNPTDWWPNVLYDTREGNVRDELSSSSTVMTLGGLMHYVALDVNNLRQWLAGAIGTSGTQVLNQNGYIVYFSDRRSNRNASNAETGEYGWEDVVNPASSTGAVNNALDIGEDFNGDGALTNYGQYPSWAGTANSVVAGALAPLDINARPTTTDSRAPCQGQSRAAVPAGAQADSRRRRQRRQHPAARVHGRVREPRLRAGQLQRDGRPT